MKDKNVDWATISSDFELIRIGVTKIECQFESVDNEKSNTLIFISLYKKWNIFV